MARAQRVAPGGMVFHVLNRAVGRMRLFSSDEDFAAFECLLEEVLELQPMRICAYALLPDHWHLVLWPEHEGDLPAFLQRLTTRHVRRWQLQQEMVGYGHVYQGRYKSFPVASDAHFYDVVRYVERNVLRAKLVRRADAWRWSSLWRRKSGTRDDRRLLGAWPVRCPRDWGKLVNKAETAAELAALRYCVTRGAPYGGPEWVQKTVRKLGLESSLRPPHRPRKTPADE